MKVIMFTSPMCAPCKAMKPVAERVMKNYISRGLTLEFENVETSDLAANLGVRSLPTFAIMDHNVLMDMAIGSQSATDLEEFIDNNL